MPRVPCIPAIDEMLTIDPPPAARIDGATAADAQQGADQVHVEDVAHLVEVGVLDATRPA